MQSVYSKTDSSYNPMQTQATSSFRNALSFRLLGLAFLGTHIPLIGLLLWYVLGPGQGSSPEEVLWVTLTGTILAAVFTLILVHLQIHPLRKASLALVQVPPGHLPALPETDVTEIQVLFSAMQDAFKRSQQLLEEKRDLITLFSHDLRSPASASIGILKILEKDSSMDDETRTALLGKLRAASMHQIEILGNVLGMMRMDIEETPQPEELLLSDLLAPAIARGTDLAEAKDIRIEAHLTESEVKVQPFILRQAVENLLSNAVKFSHPSQSIRLEARMEETTLVVAVIDQGVGFTQEQAQVLAKTTVRAGQLGTHGEKSNGLGLYLVERAAIRHGGSLTMESPGAGEGARFTVRIPNALVTD